ncbi:MAG: hypothetical protein H2067_16590 [Alcanivorax sp.]|nr:hypothetical protein [Alcanivorax sp.]
MFAQAIAGASNSAAAPRRRGPKWDFSREREIISGNPPKIIVVVIALFLYLRFSFFFFFLKKEAVFMIGSQSLGAAGRRP